MNDTAQVADVGHRGERKPAPRHCAALESLLVTVILFHNVVIQALSSSSPWNPLWATIFS
jgi:hypothetical protein